MKQFTSELAAEPAYYSFGYSVYGILEEGDDLSDLYAGGYLPFVGVADASSMVYMARSGRVLAQQFHENTYHTRLRRKSGGQFVVHDFLWSEYSSQEEAIGGILEYFRFRHGAAAMPEERLRMVLAFNPDIRLVEYKIAGAIAGYSIEVPIREGRHQWYFAYSRVWEGKHLGARIMLDFIERTKEAGLAYAYLGVTFGAPMIYKTNFRPIEYWNGREWIHDVTRLKSLLKSDSLRGLVTTDEWRETKRSFHPAIFGFSSTFMELRFLYLTISATPRVAIILFLWLAILVLAGLTMQLP